MPLMGRRSPPRRHALSPSCLHRLSNRRLLLPDRHRLLHSPSQVLATRAIPHGNRLSGHGLISAELRSPHQVSSSILTLPSRTHPCASTELVPPDSPPSSHPRSSRNVATFIPAAGLRPSLAPENHSPLT